MLLLLLAGCGYRFVVPNAPAGVKSVSVPVFQNHTTEPQVDALCTQSLREHYQRAGVLGGDASEGTVEGVVTAVSAAPFLAAPERGAFPTYRLVLAVQLTLKKNEQVARSVTVSGTEEYPSGADLLITEANRATALRRLCDALMRDGAERLSGNPLYLGAVVVRSLLGDRGSSPSDPRARARGRARSLPLKPRR